MILRFANLQMFLMVLAFAVVVDIDIDVVVDIDIDVVVDAIFFFEKKKTIKKN